jgi:hypothetical protein
MAGAAEDLPVFARGLVKRYGRLLAVDRVDLNVEPGDITASSARTARARRRRCGCSSG